MCHIIMRSHLAFQVPTCQLCKNSNGLSCLTILGTTSLYVLMCRKAVNQSIVQLIDGEWWNAVYGRIGWQYARYSVVAVCFVQKFEMSYICPRHYQKTATTPSESIIIHGVGIYSWVVVKDEQLIEKVLHASLRFYPVVLGRVICCMHCLFLSK